MPLHDDPPGSSIFQQDCAPLYYHTKVQEFLDELLLELLLL
jgi:hypothetical protein